MPLKEIHLGSATGASSRAGASPSKTPANMTTPVKKKGAPKKYALPKPDKPEIKKPVIAFYKNTEKSSWVLFPQICHNEKIAKQKVHTMTGSDKVKCIDVPEELQNL